MPRTAKGGLRPLLVFAVLMLTNIPAFNNATNVAQYYSMLSDDTSSVKA
ncbi:hypothetical protein [Bradyrhizobium uaiense]|nr:hypothetical protein [Bradyrhizobium uaiense]